MSRISCSSAENDYGAKFHDVTVSIDSKDAHIPFPGSYVCARWREVENDQGLPRQVIVLLENTSLEL